MTCNYYNCILHRNCSTLRFFLCLWPVFVLILTFFIILRQNLFVWLSYFQEKKILQRCKHIFFFFARKLAKQKDFALGWWETVSISTKASPTHRKISGHYKFVKDEDASTNLAHTSDIETSCVCTEVPGEFHAHEAAGCLRRVLNFHLKRPQIISF